MRQLHTPAVEAGLWKRLVSRKLELDTGSNLAFRFVVPTPISNGEAYPYLARGRRSRGLEETQEGHAGPVKSLERSSD